MTENETKLLRRWSKAVKNKSLKDLHDEQDGLWLQDAVKWAESLPDGSDQLEKLLSKTAKFDIEKPILEETQEENRNV